jgi:hypothetical protein
MFGILYCFLSGFCLWSDDGRIGQKKIVAFALDILYFWNLLMKNQRNWLPDSQKCACLQSDDRMSAAPFQYASVRAVSTCRQYVK